MKDKWIDKVLAWFAAVMVGYVMLHFLFAIAGLI